MTCMNRDYTDYMLNYLLKVERKPLAIPAITRITRACIINWLMKVNVSTGIFLVCIENIIIIDHNFPTSYTLRTQVPDRPWISKSEPNVEVKVKCGIVVVTYKKNAFECFWEHFEHFNSTPLFHFYYPRSYCFKVLIGTRSASELKPNAERRNAALLSILKINIISGSLRQSSSRPIGMLVPRFGPQYWDYPAGQTPGRGCSLLLDSPEAAWLSSFGSKAVEERQSCVLESETVGG